MTHTRFLEIVKSRSGFSYDKLSILAGCHRRSFSDWASEKYLMPLHVFRSLSKLASFEPEHAILPDFWHIQKASRKGGEVRNKIYGNPGTAEGRSRGGITKYQMRITLNSRDDTEFLLRHLKKYRI